MWKFIDKYLLHLTLLWTLCIFVLCATPGQYIPSITWLDLLSFDKFVHASMFFILSTMLLLIAQKRQLKAYYNFLFLNMAVIFGISLEIMQATVFVNRSADKNDMIANSFGCIVALLLKRKIYKGFVTAVNR
ncbi:MAG: VanZ family protein [Bacteroidota bacterium]